MAVGLIFAGQSMPLLATDVMLLRQEAEEARREQICVVHDKQAAEIWFNQKYGERLHRVGAWFESQFSREDLASANSAVDGDGLSIGDCHLNKNGRPFNDSEESFAQRLRTLERRISNKDRTYP